MDAPTGVLHNCPPVVGPSAEGVPVEEPSKTTLPFGVLTTSGAVSQVPVPANCQMTLPLGRRRAERFRPFRNQARVRPTAGATVAAKVPTTAPVDVSKTRFPEKGSRAKR